MTPAEIVTPGESGWWFTLGDEPTLANCLREALSRPHTVPAPVVAAPVVAALLFWGSWGWVAAALVVAGFEIATFQRAQRFSARVWRSVGLGRRSRRERGTESVYLISAALGVALLVVSILGIR